MCIKCVFIFMDEIFSNIGGKQIEKGKVNHKSKQTSKQTKRKKRKRKRKEKKKRKRNKDK